MSVPWPAELPQRPLVSDYSEEEPDNTIYQDMDSGPPKVRPRTSAKGEEMEWAFVFSDAQKAIFRTFYRDILGYGSLVFELIHPNTQVLTDFQIVPGNRPKYVPLGSSLLGGVMTTYWKCNFKVLVLP